MGRRDLMNRWAGGGAIQDGFRSAYPLIEITDDRRVLIEHHQGVVAYGRTEICVRVRFGYVRIAGKDLCLARMSAEQLVICGSILELTLHRKGDKHAR